MISIFWGLVLCVAGYAFSTAGYAILGLPMMGLGAWLVWKVIVAWNSQSISKEKWTELISNAQYQHTQDVTGIAIDAKEKVLYLKGGSQLKTYPFSDIRSWRYEQVLVTGRGPAVVRQVNNAAGLSGFFVTVKDIDHPEWRIAMSTTTEMKKWVEIFEQHVNEK